MAQKPKLTYEQDLENRILNTMTVAKAAGSKADFRGGEGEDNAPNKFIPQARMQQFNAIEDKTPERVLEDLMARTEASIILCYVLALLENGHPTSEQVYQGVLKELAPHLEYLKATDPDVCYQNALAYLNNETLDLTPYAGASLNAPVRLQEDTPRQLPATIPTGTQPSSFFSTTDNVSNTTFNATDDKANRLKVKLGEKLQSNVKTGRTLRTSLTIDFDAWDEDDIRLANGKTLGSFDRAVHDAVCTLYQDGHNEFITPSMIYRVITGKSASKLTENQVDAVLSSIRKLLRTFVTINESSTVKESLGLSVESGLLDGEIIEALYYGRQTTMLRMKSTPVLLNYASSKNQITRADLEMFRIEGVKSYSPDMIQLIQILWHRVSIMKSPSKSGISRTILFSTVYKQLDLNDRYSGATLYNKRSWVRKNSDLILQHWVNLGFITRFKPKREGPEYIGYSIEFSTDKPALTDSAPAGE